MSITTIEGQMGSGKTLLMTALIHKEYIDSFEELNDDGSKKWPNGRPIFSTYELLTMPHTPFDLPRLAELLIKADQRGIDVPDIFEGAIVGLDESYLFFDARRSSSKGNILFNSFMARTRKLEADIFIACLGWNDMDRRIKRYVSARARPRSVRDGPVRVMMKDMRTRKRIKFRLWGPSYYHMFRTAERVPLPARLTRLSALDRGIAP